jgi:hypothetical protein
LRESRRAMSTRACVFLLAIAAVASVELLAPSAALAQTAPSGYAAPTSYAYPTIDPPHDTMFSCLQTNPSCSRDPWWIEWNELQGDDPVQYKFLGPGLVTQSRFIEAIWLLWQWPEGQFLLREASAHGVRIGAVPIPVPAFAAYSERDRAIVLNRRFSETSTWMVADVLAHELKHAADDRAGVRDQRTYADCIAREQVAYEVENRYLRWVAERFGALPTASMITSSLSLEDQQLYRNLSEIAASPNVNLQATVDYRQACAA